MQKFTWDFENFPHWKINPLSGNCPSFGILFNVGKVTQIAPSHAEIKYMKAMFSGLGALDMREHWNGTPALCQPSRPCCLTSGCIQAPTELKINFPLIIWVCRFITSDVSPRVYCFLTAQWGRRIH